VCRRRWRALDDERTYIERTSNSTAPSPTVRAALETLEQQVAATDRDFERYLERARSRAANSHQLLHYAGIEEGLRWRANANERAKYSGRLRTVAREERMLFSSAKGHLPRFAALRNIETGLHDVEGALQIVTLLVAHQDVSLSRLEEGVGQMEVQLARANEQLLRRYAAAVARGNSSTRAQLYVVGVAFVVVCLLLFV
jgi:hypothetical protein